MREYWISCHAFTIGVTTNDSGIIIDSAPIVKKFIGQPLTNLTFWTMENFKDFQCRLLRNEPD